MKNFYLGLNFFGGHDTSVFAIFDDDIYALSQERISRIKHDSIFPLDAIKEMIRYKGFDPLKVEHIKVGVATKKFENRVLNKNSYELTTTLRKLLSPQNGELYIKEFESKKKVIKSSKKELFKLLLNPIGREYIFKKITSTKKTLKEIVEIKLQEIFKNAKLDINFYEHHLCHAYSAYYWSGFENSLVFSFDGEGDNFFSKIYLARDKNFTTLGESKNIYVKNAKKYEFADKGFLSVGNIYSIFTYLLGFTPHADEGKVEALAAFGDSDNILYRKLKESYQVERYNIYLKKDVLEEIFSKKFLDRIFVILEKEHISAAVQRFTEDVVLEVLSNVKKEFPTIPLTLCGGVMANVIINNKIFENLYEKIFIVPPMGDDGIAMGAGLLKYFETNTQSLNIPQMPYFGSSFSKEEIEEELKNSNLKYEFLNDEAYIKAAREVVFGKIGAIFQGKAEFGPRALGNRSIIADVRDKDIQKKINLSIKKRPLFQPFCPSILEEDRERLFEKSYQNKHMTIAFKLKDEYKELIPGAVHVDLTARAQFVEEKDNPNYWKLLKKIKKLTGYGVIINTSFNKHGRTMVLTPKQAIIDFIDTNLDFMVMDGFFIQRK